MTEQTPLVGVLMGSASDFDTVKPCLDALKEFEIPFEVRVLSAHRTPEKVTEYASGAASRGMKIMICAAGHAAHLAGAVAAQTALPVLGIPVASSDLSGVDSLYSTVQMPPGVPVATLAVGKGGAKNAGIFAAQILAVSDGAMRDRLVAFKNGLVDKAVAADRELQSRIEEGA